MDEKLRLNPKDQERLSKIMADRKLEAESIPLSNEELILHEAEELRKKREIQSKTQVQPKKGEPTSFQREKDKKTLEQVQALHLKQLQMYEIEVEKEKERRKDEVKKAEEEIKLRKQKEAQLVEELRQKAAVKDQMKLAIIAAKRKAEEEGLEFNETEFAVKLIMAKRKEDQDGELKPKGVRKSVFPEPLTSLSANIPAASPPQSPSPHETVGISETVEAAVDAVAAADDLSDVKSSDPVEEPVPNADAPIAEDIKVVEEPSSPEKSVQPPVASPIEISAQSPKRLSEILLKERSPAHADLQDPDDDAASPTRSLMGHGLMSDLRVVGRQAEETRLMMVKMNQRHIDKEESERLRISEQRAIREAELAAERERLVNLTMLGQVAEFARLEVESMQLRLENPPSNASQKQMERARLIAEAKAKAALEKNARKKKDEQRSAPTTPDVNGAVITGSVHMITLDSNHQSHTVKSTATQPSKASPSVGVPPTPAQSAALASVMKARKDAKAAAAKSRADALLVAARQKGALAAAEEAKIVDSLDASTSASSNSERDENIAIEESHAQPAPLSVADRSPGRLADETDDYLETLGASLHSQLSLHDAAKDGGATSDVKRAESVYSDGMEYSTHTDEINSIPDGSAVDLTQMDSTMSQDEPSAVAGNGAAEQDEVDEGDGDDDDGDSVVVSEENKLASTVKLGFWESLFSCASTTESSQPKPTTLT